MLSFSGKELARTWLHKLETWSNSTDAYWSPLLQHAVHALRTGNDTVPSADVILRSPALSPFADGITQDALSRAYQYLRETGVDFTLLVTQPIGFAALLSKLLLRTVLETGTFVFVAVGAVVDLGFRAVIFTMVLFYSLSAPNDLMEKLVVDFIPVAKARKPQLIAALRNSIEGAARARTGRPGGRGVGVMPRPPLPLYAISYSRFSCSLPRAPPLLALSLPAPPPLFALP